ncbi:probable xyloglucan 6-xylosyltransferase 5 [Beta vulgaris subsp. vulgaris]|uniref:probable xyloglucan 6-xylosyltransferase 5 n=1 Tax=Beta vulgaris subsp. vulgaris TaxID=3555 RepID=UPI002036A0CF|nr:probable xyloglucan 6-xylosyltransferase 5 [Beta vulgaris subsp. vulgaris]
MGHVNTANGKPTSSRILRERPTQKTLTNIKITILCGIITILVLRGTIGIENLTGSSYEAENKALVEETNRLLAEIRSDIDQSEPDVQNEPPFDPNVTYTLGPKIDYWDTQRQMWLQQNPDFPSTIHGKGRVLLVTGSPPNPCDNPIGDHYLLKGVKNKIDYCRLHGIEIMYNMAHLDKEMSGYWSKLPLIRKLMLSHPEVEWIWWLDSDALFTDMVFEIPLQKYQDHNLVIHGYPDLLYEQKSWIALNTGSFLLRNCQWSLDLLDIWAPMGPKGQVRDEAGKLLTANLKGRPAFEADDQSALIYLLISQKEKWMNKVYVENSYYLHGFWLGLVDKYEEMAEKYHPGLGDERWPFVTHFVGCKPCGSYGDYPVEKCLKSMERAFNFADNQVLKLYGFRHRGLLSPNIKRLRNETDKPLKFVDEFDIRRHIVVGPSKH